MKKIWFLLFLLGLFSLTTNPTYANDCKQVEFPNWGRVCINIEKESSNVFRLDTNIEKWNWVLRCAVYSQTMSNPKEIVWCNDDFLLNNPIEQEVKIYVRFWWELPVDREQKPNNKSKRLFPRWLYDFNLWEWSDWSSNNTDNTTTNKFQITTDNSSPDTYQRVDLSIRAQNNNNNTISDYRGTAKFEVYYRTSSSSSWIRTTSYNDFELKSSYDNTYTFRNYDNWYVTLYDAIRFKRDYDFKVKVIDDNNSSIYWERIFYVWGDYNNNTEANNFLVSTNNTSPSTNQRVDLSIRARNNNNNTVTDYRGTVRFNIYYRTSSSSSWIRTTSYNDFEFKPIYDNTYTFNYSDNWNITLYDAIRFKRNYDFKVEIVDDNNSSIYWERVFYIWEDSNNESNWFYITTNNSSPNTYERVNLFIKAQDYNNNTITNYRGTVRFEIYYRTSSSSSWIRTTSSNYFEFKSSYDNGYTFSSADYWYATLYDIIRFKRDYEYKVRIIDDNNSSVYGERIFYVWGDSWWIYGYTSTEIANIQKVYNIRDDLINSLKRSSSRLRYNQTRIDLSEDLKIEMKRILDNSSYKKYPTYREFWNAFNYRYSYTLRYK